MNISRPEGRTNEGTSVCGYDGAHSQAGVDAPRADSGAFDATVDHHALTLNIRIKAALMMVIRVADRISYLWPFATDFTFRHDSFPFSQALPLAVVNGADGRQRAKFIYDSYGPCQTLFTDFDFPLLLLLPR